MLIDYQKAYDEIKKKIIESEYQSSAREFLRQSGGIDPSFSQPIAKSEHWIDYEKRKVRSAVKTKLLLLEEVV